MTPPKSACPSSMTMTAILIALLVIAIGAIVVRQIMRYRENKAEIAERVQYYVSAMSIPETRSVVDDEKQLDGRFVYVDYLGDVIVEDDHVGYRESPSGMILGHWRKGERLGWFGCSEDEDWWLLWDVVGTRSGWTHKGFLRKV